MFQYKAILKSTKEVVAENHTLDQVLADVKHFRREQNKGLHTRAGDSIEIYHVHRNDGKEELVKVI